MADDRLVDTVAQALVEEPLGYLNCKNLHPLLPPIQIYCDCLWMSEFLSN